MNNTAKHLSIRIVQRSAILLFAIIACSFPAGCSGDSDLGIEGGRDIRYEVTGTAGRTITLQWLDISAKLQTETVTIPVVRNTRMVNGQTARLAVEYQTGGGLAFAQIEAKIILDGADWLSDSRSGTRFSISLLGIVGE